MNTVEYMFQINALDPDALVPQVSRALEKRTQLLSRRKYPKLWKYSDRLNAGKPVPDAVRKRRGLRHKVWSILCIALGVFLFVPGLTSPKELLLPLVVGGGAICVGAVVLWQGRKYKKNPFEQSAERLLHGRDQIPHGEMQAVFTPEGMRIHSQRDMGGDKMVPYQEFESFLETEDLFLITDQSTMTVLQKSDLSTGGVDEFRDFMATKTECIQ